MKRLRDVWPDFPQGRPLKPFFVKAKPRSVTVIKRIRKLPRLSEAKPVASSNPAPTPAAPAPDDRPAVLREGGAKAARNYDDEQREIGRMLSGEKLTTEALKHAERLIETGLTAKL